MSEFDRRFGSAGITIVEILIGTVLLLHALAGVVNSITAAGRHGQQTAQRYEQELLVDRDLAEIQAANARFTCAYSVSCLIGSSEPTAFGFFPSPTNTSLVDSFESLCDPDSENSNNLASTFIGLFKASHPNNNLGLDVVRAEMTPIGSRREQRYRVAYTSETTGLSRVMEFVPAAASWCP